MNEIFEENKKLVYYFYNKLPRTNTNNNNKDDIISEGMIGLWKGCKTFNETKGCALATYLGACIKNEIMQYFKKLNKNIVCLSLDEPISSDLGEDITLADTIGYEDYTLDFNVYDYVDMFFKQYPNSSIKKDFIHKILSMLAQGYTQSSVAKTLGVTRSYISKIIQNIRVAIEVAKEKTV